MIKCPKCDNKRFRIKITQTETNFIKDWTCAKCGFVKQQILQIKDNSTELLKTSIRESLNMPTKNAGEEE